MTPVPPEDRPSARDLASRSNNSMPMQIAGCPADVCPYCGCSLFANHTKSLSTTIIRHVVCRNASCGKRFVSRQEAARLVREVKTDDFSRSGNLD